MLEGLSHVVLQLAKCAPCINLAIAAHSLALKAGYIVSGTTKCSSAHRGAHTFKQSPAYASTGAPMPRQMGAAMPSLADAPQPLGSRNTDVVPPLVPSTLSPSSYLASKGQWGQDYSTNHIHTIDGVAQQPYLRPQASTPHCMSNLVAWHHGCGPLHHRKKSMRQAIIMTWPYYTAICVCQGTIESVA